MFATSRPVQISVLLPAYNAERFILPSVQSILGQTFEDFELLVVDDCSTDRTPAILDGIADPRLRVLTNTRNLGIVGSLNRAMAEASGPYIARMDADDFCTPTRFAKQKAFLDENASTVLVATEMSVLSGGHVQFSRARASLDPMVLRWMLHVGNPVGHPSMMFRADAVQRLGHYLVEELKYAEDFDFTHRMIRLGDVCVLPEHLTIYRRHEHNLTQLFRQKMVTVVVAVLKRVYADLCNQAPELDAELVAQHAIASVPVEGLPTWYRLQDALERLRRCFVERYAPEASAEAAINLHLRRLWNRMVQNSLRAGRLREASKARVLLRLGEDDAPARHLIAASAGLLLPLRPSVRAVKNFVAKRPSPALPSLQVSDTTLHPLLTEQDKPPTLYVVVDTEAEFNWDAPLDRLETRVTSAASQSLAQAIFDEHGVRPVYVVDYSISSQPQGYEPLRSILRRHGCLIGAHLHPWTTPPFDEEVSERNSFAGNLPPDLEERKLRTLIASIEDNFGIKPLFYKAGRYGLGPTTLKILERLGFQVDFSIIPLTDLRTKGGPDFRRADAFSYRSKDSIVTSVPMMRGQVGLLSPVPMALHNMVQSRIGRQLRLPGILSRIGLLNTVTLTPEGMAVDEQVALIRAMERRGHRNFVLHYHSSSLGAHTPYVRSAAELEAFLANIRAVCGFFLSEFGGIAGNPVDLLPPAMRPLAFPAVPSNT